ncbi:multisubunit potassium/proton antiporter, PhaC subunit [Donghicola eburneus]|jgi:multicomponent K+:H+ antiporter subunit C|uniref:Putative membrane protein n=1 Tax=Donghicola eburneus TaxID=393278 RepID=A0A1M4N336_9RHOB|nr:putative membrane protein [Donghicola eburneus]SFQ44511.1 multisubunit potassium/proton antiporter, PhaC subunit [Donghicola eburneus]
MTIEFLVASAIGVLTAAGIYLILRFRTFPVILGTSFLSYAVNIYLFSTGRLIVGAPPVLQGYGDYTYTDPLPQALVLTAIVIGFGMTAVVLMIALAAYLSGGHDKIDMQDDDASEDRA